MSSDAKAPFQRGSSGARIRIFGDRAVKLVDDSESQQLRQRIIEQGLWLQRHRSPAVPHVFQVYSHAYVMERLIVPPLSVLDHQRLLDGVLLALSTHVWSNPPEVPHDVNETAIKYNALCERFDLQRVAHELDVLQVNIDWDQLKTCLTHGDPTFENVMFRPEELGDHDAVIADPIPATPAVPDVRAVDLGKVLQSLLGWELVRYGPKFTLRVTPSDLRRRIHDQNEWRATVFWAIVHILRALPYVSVDVQTRLKGRIDAAISLGV